MKNAEKSDAEPDRDAQFGKASRGESRADKRAQSIADYLVRKAMKGRLGEPLRIKPSRYFPSFFSEVGRDDLEKADSILKEAGLQLDDSWRDITPETDKPRISVTMIEPESVDSNRDQTS